MSVPSPPQPLDGHCSVILNDVLYVLSSNSFQSLPLKEKSQWTTLPQGEAVTDPSCVLVDPNDDPNTAAMYVIGGTSQNATYGGVQRFNFTLQAWETLHPPTSDMVGRTNHSVAYLPATNSILVYAGGRPQMPSDLSSQTFVLTLTGPYGIRAFTSNAPPGNRPILQTLDDQNAILMGSFARSKEIWSFNAFNGWSQYSASLATGIKEGVRGLILTGSDGSKVLSTYDATVSPNVVGEIVLANAGGVAPPVATPLSGGTLKRAVTMTTFPTYNTSDAPSIVRNDYNVADDGNGLAVITGGSSTSPLNIFNNTRNAWVDNGLFFDGTANGNQVPLSASSTVGMATSTAKPTSSISAIPANTTDTSTKPKMLRILGIVLGVLFGIAALFIIVLLLLRYRRQKRSQKYYVNEKRMSFQDRGAPVMINPDGSRLDLSQIPPNHRFTQHNTSHNSFAFVAGKLAGRNASRNNLSPTGGRGSSESTRQLVIKKSDISKPVELDMWGRDKEVYAMPGPVTGVQAPEAALTADKPRSGGWSKYFQSDALPSAYGRKPTVSTYTVGTEFTTDETRPPLPSAAPPVPRVAGRGPTVSTYTVGTEYTLGDAEAPPVPAGPLPRTAGRGPTVSTYTVGTEYTLGETQPPVPTAPLPNTTGRGPTVSTYTVGTEYTLGETQPPMPTEPVPTNPAIPAPLFNNKSREAERIAKVIARNPNFSNSAEDLARRGSSIEAARGQRANVFADGEHDTTDGYDTDDSDFDSSVYLDQTATRSSTASNWTPVDNQYDAKTNSTALGEELKNARAPSSAYSASYYGNPESRVISTRGNTTLFSSLKEGTPINSQLFPAPPIPQDGKAINDPGRESTLTVFPKGVPSAYYANRNAAKEAEKTTDDPNAPKQDMSWLNLGLK